MDEVLRSAVYSSNQIGKFLGYFSTKFQYKLLSFYKERKVVDLIKNIKNDVNFAFFPYEAYMLYSIAKSQRELDGDMAEVGVYQGGSARLISEVKGDRKLFLFDTFIGLQELSDDDTHFGKKHWKKNKHMKKKKTKNNKKNTVETRRNKEGFLLAPPGSS